MSARVQPATQTDLVILEAEPGHFQLSAYRYLHIFAWLQTPTPSAVMRVDRVLAARSKTLTHFVSAIHIVAPEAGAPDGEARTALIEMVQRRGERTACGAVVVERGGLLGLAVRSAVTGIIILAPKHYRVKVFETVETCAPWVSEQHEKVTSEPFDASEILDALRRARESAL